MLCDRHCLRDEVDALRHLPKERCGGSPENARELVRLDAGNAGANVGGLKPGDRVAWMVEGNLEEILAHWTRGLTIGFVGASTASSRLSSAKPPDIGGWNWNT